MLRGWLLRRRARDASPTIRDADADIDAHPIRGRVTAYRVLSLASATRDYAQALEAGRFGRLDAGDLSRLSLAMGPEIWAWQYALRLTGQTPWRAGTEVETPRERVRADRLMKADIATWEAALAALDAETERARLYGKPEPEPLNVPAAVLAAIEARRAAALERVTRRRSQAGDGRSGPAPDGTVRPPSPPV